MRLALLADIHANFVALEAVLADIGKIGADGVVCLGDVAATGPQPREVVERLRDLKLPVVMGNADAWMLNPVGAQGADADTRRFEEIDTWCVEQLSSEDVEYLRTFQPTHDVALPNGRSLLLFHGSPRDNREIILSTTPDTDLDEMFIGAKATVMAGGHTHLQMVRCWRGTLLINPGSIGLPYVPTSEPWNPPWAEYALLETDSDALSIMLRRIPIDVTALAKAALLSGMPHADWWVAGWNQIAGESG